MDLNNLFAAIGSHNYLLIVLLVAMYCRTLFGPKSRFPLTLSPNWLPVFSGVCGAVITIDSALMAGKSTGEAAMLGIVGFVGGGFVDAVVVGFFGSPANAPTVIRAALFLIDDLFGGGGGGSAKKTTVTVEQTETHAGAPPPSMVVPIPQKMPDKLRRRILAPYVLITMSCLCVLGLAGCALFGASAAKQAQDAASEIACVQAHWGEPILQLAAACTGSEIALAEDILADVELLLEKSTDAGVAASFPYSDNASVMNKIMSMKHS